MLGITLGDLWPVWAPGRLGGERAIAMSGFFKVMEARRRAKDVKRRYPREWDKGEQLFYEYDSKRRFDQRPTLESVLGTSGSFDPLSDQLLDPSMVREMFADPRSAGPGLKLEELTDIELRLYYIVFDAITADDLVEMCITVLDENWSEISGGRNLTPDTADYVMSLGFINAYMRRRFGGRGF
jgi:hypothetical protein